MQGSKYFNICTGVYRQEYSISHYLPARNDKIYIHRGAHLVLHLCRYMEVIPTLKSFYMEDWWESKARTLRRRKQSLIL